MNKFEISSRAKDCHARTGIIKTPHGIVHTPFFMPVATKAAVKTLSVDELEKIGFEIILSNTYHLIEKPGLEALKLFGGLHRFMSWERSILSDSGGYQVFSLHKMVRIEEEGIRFRSLIDGREIAATPESVLQWQHHIGSDMVMVLDVCTPYGISREKAREAMEITTRWAERSKRVWQEKDRMIFGIVQGSFYPELREEAAKRIVELDFDGYAAGGLSVGEPRDVLLEMAEIVASQLPEDRPRYLMGLGDPVTVLECIALGYDMFDSALPTRIARGGAFFTANGAFNIRNSRFEHDDAPLEEGCKCLACKHYSRAYIRHTYLSDETLALRLLTYHNLFFMQNLIKKARKAIEEGYFLQLVSDFKEGFNYAKY